MNFTNTRLLIAECFLLSFLFLFSTRAARCAGNFPPCGSGEYTGTYLIPGPGEPGYDAALALKAHRYERQFHLFNALPMGVNVDAVVPVSEKEHRELIEGFLHNTSSWDFEEYAGGQAARDVIGGWHKVAGLYAGAGIAADAFRYSVLRRQGADCREIDRARRHLIDGLDSMHIAFTIAGKPGVVARGFILKDLPGMAENIETVPLFDSDGRPLPPVKNNGTWREDQSGLYPEYVWEDSISRDQVLGWAMASAAAIEATRGDETIPEAVKERIKEDSSAFLEELMVVRESGYDLEFPDADGRTTFHGYLNENNVDGAYLPGLKNGFYALMALGITGAFTYASDLSEAEGYIYEELIGERHLPEIALDYIKFVDRGTGSNFSNWNMAITAALLALRYIDHADARKKLLDTLDRKLYNGPPGSRRPVELKQSLFDLVYSGAVTGGTAFNPPDSPHDALSADRALETLGEFPSPPFWNFARTNCDEDEIEAKECVLDDGTEVGLAGYAGWNGNLVADSPIPMRVRPPSNYYWRSNPYEPNGGGDGSALLPGVDFRIAYWLGRWTVLAEE